MRRPYSSGASPVISVHQIQGNVMSQLSSKPGLCSVIAAIALLSASTVGAQTVQVSTFATGAGVNATAPDSIAVTKNSVWVSYTNGAQSDGTGGSSTIVQYKLRNGKVRSTYSIAGSVDGLKIDPSTGAVWALQNQDGNSTITLIDPEDHTVSKPIPYAVKSATRGVDDAAFRVDETFLSYTNPVVPSDPTILLVHNGSNPVVVTPILQMGATGTDLATGLPNQPTSQSDPDSLRLTPYGDLMLTSGANAQLIFVSHPGTAVQSVSFLNLLDHAKQPVADLDDAAFVTAHKGTFFLADTGNNRILKINAAELPVGALYASVSSLNALVAVDLKTGVVTPIVGNLQGPHGLQFVARTEEDEDCQDE
jgi:glutamine cyclotransferase